MIYRSQMWLQRQTKDSLWVRQAVAFMAVFLLESLAALQMVSHNCETTEVHVHSRFDLGRLQSNLFGRPFHLDVRAVYFKRDRMAVFMKHQVGIAILGIEAGYHIFTL